MRPVEIPAALPRYRLEPGRHISRDGIPIVYVQRVGSDANEYALAPAEADAFARQIVDALNATSKPRLEALSIYMRREPTNDPNAPHYHGRKAFEVCAYASEADLANGKVKARWPWFREDKPRPGRKTVMLNCFRWRAIWLPDIERVNEQA